MTAAEVSALLEACAYLLACAFVVRVLRKLIDRG